MDYENDSPATTNNLSQTIMIKIKGKYLQHNIPTLH